MSLLSQLVQKLENRHFALDIIEQEEDIQINPTIVVGATVPTRGRHPKELKDNLVKIDADKVSDAKRMAIISKTGSGKTTLMASMLFGAKLAGFQLFIPFDPKPEFSSMLRHLSTYYLGRDIFEGDIVELYPYYLKSINAGIGSQSFFQFDIGDLSEAELAILLNIFSANDHRKRNLLFNIIDKMPRGSSITDVLDILSSRMKLDAMAAKARDATVMAIIEAINPMIRYGTLGNAHRKPIEAMIHSGKTINACFPRYDSLHESITQGYVAVLEKMLKHSLERKKRHVLTAIDEGRLIIPKAKSEGESSRKEIIKNIKTTRYLGESIMFGVQDLKDVEESVVSQASVYFISHLVQKRDIERLIESTSFPGMKDRIMHELIPQLHARVMATPSCRPWLMITDLGEGKIVYPFLGR